MRLTIIKNQEATLFHNTDDTHTTYKELKKEERSNAANSVTSKRKGAAKNSTFFLTDLVQPLPNQVEELLR